MAEATAVQKPKEKTLWIWDPEARRILAANDPALAFWGATNISELSERPFPPEHPFVQAAEEARKRLDSDEAMELSVELAVPKLGRVRAHLKFRRPYDRDDLLEERVLMPVELLGFNQRTMRQDGAIGLPDAVMDAAPVPFAILSDSAGVISVNDAARALLGENYAASWSSWFLNEQEARNALRLAFEVGGASFAGVLRGGSSQQPVNVSVARFVNPRSDGVSALATLMPIVVHDALIHSSNDAELLLKALPHPAAIFAADTHRLIVANQRAQALSMRLKRPGTPESAIESVFERDRDLVLGAIKQLYIRGAGVLEPVRLSHPSLEGAALEAQFNVCFWRSELGDCAVFAPSDIG